MQFHGDRPSLDARHGRRLRPWSSCLRHGRSGRCFRRFSPTGCRSRPPSAPATCRPLPSQGPAGGSEPSSAHRRSASQGTGAGRSNGAGPGESALRWRPVARTRRTASAASRGSAARGHPIRPCTGGVGPTISRSSSAVAYGRSSGRLQRRRASSQGMAIPFHGCSGARMRPIRQWRGFP